jgi:hypothetical protein
MSFLAKLKLGSEYNILTVEYDISQMMDHDNRPTNIPKGGLIQVMIESSNNNELLEWMVHPTMLKNGQIDFFRRDANSSMKTVEFTDAFCVYLKEIFTADGKTPMVTRLTISARELKIRNLTISNPWPGMKSGAATAPSQQISTYAID